MYDFHVHSNFSADSPSSMSEMIIAGKSKGLRGICFTDHIDLDYPSTEIQFTFNYNDYINELNNVKYIHSKDFEIYSGLEIGIQPHLSEMNEYLLKDKRFDFVIASIHCVNKCDMYDGSYLEGITNHEGIKRYFLDLILCIESFENFDVIGHLDGIRRYLREGEESFSFDVYKEYIHNVLSKLVNSNKGIEINTSGLRYGLSSIHPIPDILKLYRSLGGEIVTIGSDSHSPDTLGYNFKEAFTLLSDIGFKYYSIFKERKPIFIEI